MENNTTIFKVGQIAEYVRLSLSLDPLLNQIKVQGEISNLRHYSSGHLYFTLKDEDALLRCVMFRTNVLKMEELPRDGEKVVVKGSVSVYVKDGQLQLYCEEMHKQGLGDLYQMFMDLRYRLEKEGLFDSGRKKPLPLFPKRIGVVTSPSGAVIRDIIQVARRRNPKVDILLYPSLVQGEKAPFQLMEGLQFLSKLEDIDVIIIGRGGGSLEDLWPFNDEALARAIAACSKPVVSAVGHETDFTIADFVADLRAPTPSAASELVIPLVSQYQMDLDQLKDRLLYSKEMFLSQKKQDILYIAQRLALQEPIRQMQNHRRQVQLLKNRLDQNMRQAMAVFMHNKELLHARLEAFNPASVLDRGYALIQDRDGNILHAEDLNEKQIVSLHFSDGKALAQITEVHLHAKEG